MIIKEYAACATFNIAPPQYLKKKGKNIKKAKNKTEMLLFLPITSRLPLVANHCLEDVCFEMDLDSRKFSSPPLIVTFR